MSNQKVHITGEMVQTSFQEASHIIFEVTEKCNFRCLYCAYGKNYVQPELRPLNSQRYMSWETARTLIDRFISYWRERPFDTIRATISFYGGEPLLNFTLIDRIVSYIKANKPDNVRIQYRMTTNGFLLKKHLPFLMENDFQVSVSLDGDALANKYRRFRNGKETYPVVKKNVDFVYKTAPDFFRSNLSFLSVLNNNSSVVDILSFFDKEYRATSDISSLSKQCLSKNSHIEEYYKDYDSCRKEDFENRPEEWKKLRLISPIRSKVIRSFKRISPYNYYTYTDFFKTNEPVSDQNNIICETCVPFSCRLFLTVEGYIFPCEKIDLNNPLGRIVQDRIELDFEKIADRYTTIYNTANRFCTSCIHQKDCGHCFLMDRKELSDKGVRFCSEYEKETAKNTRECAEYIKEHIEEF